MQPFSQHVGLVAPLDRVNVDTDQMVPTRLVILSEAKDLLFHGRG